MQGTLFLPEREKSGRRSGPNSCILPWLPTIRSIHPSMRDEPSSPIKTYNVHVRKLILKDIHFKIFFWSVEECLFIQVW